MTHTTSKKSKIIENIAQNPRLDLHNYREWLQKKAELEAAGINTVPSRKTPEPERCQPIPFSMLGL